MIEIIALKEEAEALKRLRQETCPATYMPDFDKDKCCDIIQTMIEVFDIMLKKHVDFCDILWTKNYEEYLEEKNKQYDTYCEKVNRKVDYDNWFRHWIMTSEEYEVLYNYLGWNEEEEVIEVETEEDLEPPEFKQED